jgi:peptide/histidine transporter 3/4
MQVIVVAFKNRKLPLPETNEQLYEVYKDATTTTTLEKIAHTNQMR